MEALKKADSKLQIIVQESSTVVVELTTRRTEILEVKTDAPVLTVHAIKSLDDAIDFIGSADSGPALAAYHFGNPQVGKYLAQFVDARISFVNNIPRELLVGPAHPSSHAVDPSIRYPIDIFTLARPSFIQPTTSSSTIAALMSSTNGSVAQKYLEQALSPLVEMKRKPGGGVGMLSSQNLFVAIYPVADPSRSRLLRARLPHECWHAAHSDHQRDCSRYYLVGEEWKDPVMGNASVARIVIVRSGDVIIDLFSWLPCRKRGKKDLRFRLRRK